MAETPEEVAARFRTLKQLAQSFGSMLQNQFNNKKRDDSQAAIAKKISSLKPPTFIGREDQLALEAHKVA